MDAIEALSDGSGRLVLLTGPAGAGKTHRATAIAQEARQRGFAVVWAAGSRPGAPAFWPWAQVLRSIAEADEETARVERALAAGDVAAEGSDRRARFELFEDIVRALARAAEPTPLLVVLDDLHDRPHPARLRWHRGRRVQPDRGVPTDRCSSRSGHDRGGSVRTVYLGHYAFDGDPTLLEAAYRRLAATYPPGALELHIVVIRRDGLDIYDSCPDEETFIAFHTSEQFIVALASAGLPTPSVTGLGDVVSALLKEPIG